MLSAVKSLRQSDAERFEHLVREHEAGIYRVAFRLCGNRDDTEDLVQETLLEAFRAFNRFRIGSHFDRWVYRIMRNTHIDRVRRKPKCRVESLDSNFATQTDAQCARDVPARHSEPDLRLMARTLDGPIQKALDDLPEDFKAVVILSDIEELTYEEISRIIGCPIGTVRSRLHRGRTILKDRLKCYARI